MDDLSDSIIAHVLEPYGFSPSGTLCAQIRSYLELLLAWNKRISLTAVRNPAEILRFHFGESLFAASVTPIRSGRLVDVGSGAGFPGLVLALAVPEIQVLLIESNAKKAAFLAEAIRTVGVRNASVLRQRLESLPTELDKLDFVTARAVGCYDTILRWATAHLSDSGKVMLWIGKDAAAQVAHFGGWKWAQHNIPGSKSRLLLVSSPS